jgi:Restriction endonuclease
VPCASGLLRRRRRELWHHWLCYVEENFARDIGVVGIVGWKWVFGGGAREREAAREQLAEMVERLRSKRNSMSGQEFERFMARVFQSIGYDVDIVGGPGDQGVDLLVRVGRKRVAVQCKLHTRPVGRRAVADVYAGAQAPRSRAGVAGRARRLHAGSAGAGREYGGPAIGSRSHQEVIVEE